MLGGTVPATVGFAGFSGFSGFGGFFLPPVGPEVDSSGPIPMPGIPPDGGVAADRFPGGDKFNVSGPNGPLTAAGGAMVPPTVEGGKGGGILDGD